MNAKEQVAAGPLRRAIKWFADVVHIARMHNQMTRSGCYVHSMWRIKDGSYVAIVDAEQGNVPVQQALETINVVALETGILGARSRMLNLRSAEEAA